MPISARWQKIPIGVKYHRRFWGLEESGNYKIASLWASTLPAIRMRKPEKDAQLSYRISHNRWLDERKH